MFLNEKYDLNEKTTPCYNNYLKNAQFSLPVQRFR